MDDIEAVGELAEGALIARAVEPAGGERVDASDGHTHEQACLNCGTALVGSHCHACGQKAHVHRTIGAFLHDLLHGALHFEGKIWHTLPLLAWKPGALTRRYIDGERARFVSPMALFLFSVFLMFAVFQLISIAPGSEASAQAEGGSIAGDNYESQLIGLQEARKEIADDSPAAPILDARIEALKGEHSADTPDVDPKEIVLVEGEGSGLKLVNVNTGVAAIDHALEKWQENPSLMAYKLQANSYKFSWLLIPLSVPFVWLLFAWKRQFGAYDHAVFVTYSLAFMTLFYLVLTLLGTVGIWGEVLFFTGLLVPPYHIYRQLKGAYGLSRLSALWRTGVLLVFVLLILLIFLNVILLLGAT